MNRILSLQEKFKKFPFGKSLFSYFVARSAPYFLTIKPKIIELKPHFCKISMRKKRRIENHLKTVHAIAMCNLCELTGGLCLEVSLPKKYRWIPVGMKVAYLKKAKTDLTATCELRNIDWETANEVFCFVSVKDTNNLEVMNANIEMKISLKK